MLLPHLLSSLKRLLGPLAGGRPVLLLPRWLLRVLMLLPSLLLMLLATVTQLRPYGRVLLIALPHLLADAVQVLFHGVCERYAQGGTGALMRDVAASRLAASTPHRHSCE